MHRYLLCGLIALLTACGGQISGKVYFDKNANNIMEEGEYAVKYVAYKVTLNGNDYKTGYTDENGNFSFPKSHDIQGSASDYCLTIATSSNQYFDKAPDLVVNPTPSAGKAMDGTSTNDSTTGNSSTSNDSTTKKEPVQLPPLPGPASGKNCIRVQQTMGKDQLDVGFSINYDATMDLIPPQNETLTVRPSEEFEVKEYYPRFCKLLDLALPESLQPRGKGAIESSNSFNLAALQPKSLKEEREQAEKSIKGYNLSTDLIYNVPLKLKVLDSITFDNEEKKIVTINPKAICPGEDKIRNLGEIKLSIIKEEKLLLVTNFNHPIEQNKTVTMTLIVQNKSISAFKDSENITMVFPSGTQMNTITPGDLCGGSPPKSLTVICQLPEIAGNSEAKFEVNFMVTTYSDEIDIYPSFGDPQIINFPLK